jgi:hypothetical protein
MLQDRVVTQGTRCYEQVCRRNRHTSRAGLTRKVVCSTPDCFVDPEFRQQALEISQRFFLAITACAVPEFQPNDRAPAGFA